MKTKTDKIVNSVAIEICVKPEHKILFYDDFSRAMENAYSLANAHNADVFLYIGVGTPFERCVTLIPPTKQ